MSAAVRRTILLIQQHTFRSRLSPLYLMITVIGELMTSYVVDKSKFWVHERSDLRCQQYWWRNVLYIQNLFDIDDLCLNWTWSLACEMQYYMISVGLLFVYAKYVCFWNSTQDMRTPGIII